MRSARALPSALAALALLGASPAAAQDIMAVVSDFEGRDGVTRSFDLDALGDTTAAPINIEECESDAVIDFRFTMIDTTRSFLQFFEGTQCTDASVRNDNTLETCLPLGFMDTAINGNSQLDIAIPVSTLVPCDSGGAAAEDIWALALDNNTSEVTGAGQSLEFDIAYDLQPPAMPTITARDGSSGSRVEVSGITEVAVAGYDGYLVPNGCTDGEVTAEELMGDTITIEPIVSPRGGVANSITLPFPGRESFPDGSEAAVAVRVVDIAGNPGPVSMVECVERIPLNGWYNNYCGEGTGTDCPSCAARPGPSRPAGWVLIGAALAGVALRRRRRGRS